MALAGTVQKFADLPDAASTGSIYRVMGASETSFVPYYVIKSVEGVWDETVSPGLENIINPLTMPHALVRQGDGTFKFLPFAWDDRVVGDLVTNPDPGFIGRNIRKVFINQNRLAFLYDENTILSGSGEFGRFFRLTILDYLDSDPIDVAATSSKVSILQDAVPFNDGVLLFSDQTQFSMTNGEAGLSATSLAIRPVTHYESTIRASPVALGSEVYFAADGGGHAMVHEYTRSGNTDATAASNITAHVPRYIPSGVTKLIPAGDLNTLFVLTDGDKSAVYVYQFYWADGSTKAMSAWHRWSLSAEDHILSGSYTAGRLSLVISRPSGVFLERLNMTSGDTVGASSGFPYIDRRTLVTGVYAPLTGRTTYVLPRPVLEPSRFQLVHGPTYPDDLAGYPIDPAGYVWADSSTVSVPGDSSAAPVHAGLRFVSRWRPSQPYIRRPDGTAVTNGRLQLRTLRMSFRNTAMFSASVLPYGVGRSDPTSFTYTSLGVDEGRLNTATGATGDVAVTISANAETAVVDIINDTPFGCGFQSAAWEAFFWARSR